LISTKSYFFSYNSFLQNFFEKAVLHLAILKVGFMKSIGKNLLPEFIFNPINRDLLVVISIGLMIAVAISTFLAMLVSQI